MQEKPIHIYYAVNALLPNERAHGIQIVNTCAAIAKQPNIILTLCTPKKVSDVSIFSHYRVANIFTHKQLMTFNPVWGDAGFYLRLFSYLVSLTFFIIIKMLSHKLRREKMLLYVRGESVLALWWLKLFIPVVFESHQVRGMRVLYEFALKLVTGVVVITNNLKDTFVRELHMPPEQITVARDAVDVGRFANASCSSDIRVRYNVPAQATIILYVGSLGSEKGVLTLLEAAQYIPEGLHIVLAGGTEAEVQNLSKQYQSDTIHFLGKVPHEDVPSLMQCADFLVQPESGKDIYSKLYTSPMKLFEYIAARKPIVAADVPSLREVLDESTAIFFTADDPVSLANTLAVHYSNTNKKDELTKNLQYLSKEVTWDRRGEVIVCFLRKQF